MTEETPKPAAKPKATAKPKAAATPKAAAKPKAAPNPKPSAKPAPTKAEKLAAEALDAGKPILQSETGRKAAAFSDTAFTKGEELVGKALDSDLGKKASATAQEYSAKALDTDLGKKASEYGKQAMDSEAGRTAKKLWETPLGRNVGTGVAAGAAAGLVLPIPGGAFLGAVIGGGLGYLRTLAKKR